MKDEKWSKSISVCQRNGKTIIVPNVRNRHRRKFYAPKEKFIAIEKDSGKKICGIIMHNGKIFLGEDVWRLSNRIDCCEYPFKQISEIEFDFYYTKEDNKRPLDGKGGFNAIS